MSDIRFSNLPCIPGLFFGVLTVFLLIFIPLTFAEEPDLGAGKATGHWTVSGGFGTTHPGFGATESRVETVDVILSYGHFLSEEIGRSWYKGRHEILVELPLHLVVKPETTPMAGITFLASWTFTASKTITPYIFCGGGLLYTDLEVPELGKKLNGTHQAGAGFHYFFKKNTSLDLSYRFHHISNAGTGEPNGPLNSSKILFGISFFR
jgi:lipid A 3-O-deacylase